jgi:hypothetical protein
MQREKASAPFSCADATGVLEEELSEPPHAAASRVRLAVATIATAVGAVGGHARRGRRMTGVLSFIMAFSGLDDRGGRRRRRTA